MSANKYEIMHLAVTRRGGRTVHREHVSRSSFSSSSNYYRAVRNRRDQLVKKYPEQDYRVDMVLAHSVAPVAFSHTSS